MARQPYPIDTIRTDLLIIGSEGAGCMAAIGAGDDSINVLMVTKGQWGRSGATVTGIADFSVDSRSLKRDFGFRDASLEDSQELFFRDTVRGGKYQNNQRLVQILVQEAPRRLRSLIDWGAQLDQVIVAPGHTYPRGVFAPGPTYVQVIKRRAMSTPNLNVLENTVVLDLLAEDNVVKGAIALNMETGTFLVLQAKAVVLATGGGMSTYKYSTAPCDLTGDGTAMAARAGISLVDMEFPMFFPGVFAWPPALKKLDVPYQLSGAKIVHGYMYNRRGDRFMRKWDPERIEHATRDIVSVGMYSEILAGNGSRHGGIYVSLKHLPDDLIDDLIEWDPLKSWQKYGFGKASFDLRLYLPDIKRQSLEAVPACHFFNGGVVIDERCQTEVAGLFAAGEVAGGIHGGNRLSGNAFADFLVFGKIAGESARRFVKGTDGTIPSPSLVEKAFAPYFSLLERRDGVSAFKMKRRLQDLAWEKLGVVRTRERIGEALRDVQRCKVEISSAMGISNRGLLMNRELLAAVEARNIAQTIELIAVAALQRPESRAAHFLADNPMTDYKEWSRNIKVKAVGGAVTTRIDPIVGGVIAPPDGVVPYGQTEAE